MTDNAIHAIVICFDYDDLLAITLPRNTWHFSSCLVVTHPDDAPTIQLVESLVGRNPCELCYLVTDAFYRHGSRFNKGLAMEEGFDALDKNGWVCVWDADVLMPGYFPGVVDLDHSTLYGCHRRIVEDPTAWDERRPWRCYPRRHDARIAGYFQLFRGDGPYTKGQRPWYDATWTHCGGCDELLNQRFPRRRQVKLDYDVLHLGPADTNWYGRVTPHLEGRDLGDVAYRKDEMERLLRAKGWGRRRTGEQLDERVQLPSEVD